MLPALAFLAAVGRYRAMRARLTVQPGPAGPVLTRGQVTDSDPEIAEIIAQFEAASIAQFRAYRAKLERQRASARKRGTGARKPATKRPNGLKRARLRDTSPPDPGKKIARGRGAKGGVFEELPGAGEGYEGE